jgi:hypothetical protein
MNREEATRALEVLRAVVSQARDDTALQNWGVIWILHGITNGAGFIATNYLFLRGIEEPWPYAAMWGVILTVNIGSIFLLKKRRAGARSFVETQIWSIWLTFIGAVILLSILNHVMGLRAFYLGPVIGVLAAAAFSMMGALMGRRWYFATAVFSLAAICMAILPRVQFLVLGIVWGIAQTAAGIRLQRERQAKLARGEADGPRLV